MLRHADAVTVKNLEENNRHFIEARDRLDKWAADMELAAGKELDDVKRRIQELQRQSRQGQHFCPCCSSSDTNAVTTANDGGERCNVSHRNSG